MDRIKYGFQKAWGKLIENWKINIDLAARLFTESFSAISATYAFISLLKSENKKVANYTQVVKKFVGKFSGTLIKQAKNQLIKRLGKTAALGILGGVSGVAFAEITTFTFYFTYYSIRYK